MNFFTNIIPEKLISAFGWMIIHSLWEGALVALLLFVVLLMLNKKSAKARYMVSVGAMIFFAAISVRTFVDHYNVNEEACIKNAAIVSSQTSSVELIKKETQPNKISGSNFFDQLSENYISYFYQHLPFVVTIYLLGVLFLSLKLMGGLLYTQRLKHNKLTTVEEKFELLKNQLIEKIDIKQKVKIFESALVKVPVTLGYLKPIILFPIGTLSGLSYTQVEAIIAHELAHIKRADYLINFFQCVLEVLFFYHPAIWWISSIIKEERENVCDDIALETSEQPAELARALVFISQYETLQTSFAMSAIGNKNTLIRRVKRMMGENKNRSIKSKAYAASLMLLITMAFGVVACSTTSGEIYQHDRKDTLVYEEDRDGDRRYINTDRLENQERSYIFYKRYKGDRLRWEVTMDDDEIISLYKDGERVSSDEYYMYEDMILDEVEDIDWELEVWDKELADVREDLKDIKINIDDDFIEEMASLKDELKNIKIEIDDDFAEDMREMSENIKVNFDGEKFREEMAKLKEELKGIKVDVNWDSDEFRKGMEELSKELSNIKVDVDLTGLGESMRTLKEELKDLDINMDGLKEELEVMHDFFDELKEEMIDDGIIKDGEDFRRLEFEDNALYINHKKVPHELYLKYREIYKKYYDEYPDEDSFRYYDGDRW